MTSSPGSHRRQQGVEDHLLAAGGDGDLLRLDSRRLVLALELAAMAAFSASVPSTVVYFVSPRRMAAIAASLMLSGVSKSGSPAPRPMTSRPAAFSSRAFWVTAMVGEGLMRDEAFGKKLTWPAPGWKNGGATLRRASRSAGTTPRRLARAAAAA